MSLRILVADDHPLLLHGLRLALAEQPHLSMVGEAHTGELALKLALDLKPDLVVMDVHLPDMNGVNATRQILCVLPAIKIIIFSSDAGSPLVDEALQAGACGYVSKTGAMEELLQAIDLVMAGKLCLSPDASACILENYRKSLTAGPETSKAFLSEREKELLRLIADGRRNKEIASELAISAKSVETYRSRLTRKDALPPSYAPNECFQQKDREF